MRTTQRLGTDRGRSWPATLTLCLGVALVVYVLGSWARLLVAGTETIEDKDWVGFHRAGWLFLHDQLASLYSGLIHSQTPFLYPPFVVWLCVPLAAWASPWPPYLICVGVAVLGALAALRLVQRVTGASGERTLTAAAALFASAPFLGCVMTGQLSGLLLGLLAASLWTWRSGRPLTAGLLLAGLAIKPNLFVPLALLLVVGRHARVAAGAALGLAALLLVSLPLGPAVWSDYRAATSHVLSLTFDGTLAPWMHETLYAFWTWVFAPLGRRELVLLAWLVTVAIACATVCWSWWRTRGPEALPRLYGQAVLATIAVLPYLYFYDGLLLAVPALVWYLEPESFASRRAWRACGTLLVLVFAWQQVQMFTHYEGCPPLIGPLCLLWLLLDARDLRAAARS